ncbi:MAG TPA: Xaa-Pro peptidase family protein [Opitutaceae bacterium]|jgi:Xaa-Pro aminopeptidase|nr:Xaa-Pro peptidase family protein [Opitutaceae bacterium]
MPVPLLYADTSHSADQLYFCRLYVPDPFIAFTAGGKKHGIFNRLEFGRAQKESALDVVLPLEPLVERAKARWPDRQRGPAEVIALLAKEHGLDEFTVPQDFPAGLADKLRAHGLAITVADGAFFPEREIKTPAEARALREGNRCSAAGIAAAERVLRASKIKGRKLFWRNAVLTSERLKLTIETACLEAGSVSLDTIAAGGDQACDPHARGTGPLRPHELIIVDVFPRVNKTGYHGDMTRTFLKGRASDAQRALVAAVRSAQKLALKDIRAGVSGRAVHGQVVVHFESLGYKTGHDANGSTGFFHGTGHGLGLEVHEPPRMGTTADTALKKGAVVTVEPGLYYPGLGACRIEDVVQVTDNAPKMLSKYHYEWELR